MACLFNILLIEWYLAIPLVLSIVYWYLTSTFDHWKKKGVHYMKPTIFFGNLKDRLFLKLSFQEFTLDVYKKFKGHRYAGMFEGRGPRLVLLDPELIKDVCVRDFEHFTDRSTIGFKEPDYLRNMLLNIRGAHWKKVRAVLTPSFTSGKLKAMEPLVMTCAEQMIVYLNQLEDPKKEIEMKEFFGRFTLDVIASCAFGIESNSLKDPDSEFVQIMGRFDELSTLNRFFLLSALFLLPNSLRKFVPVWLTNRTTVNYMADVVRKTKAYRIENNVRRNDFLQLMIDIAQNENEKVDGNTKSIMDEPTIIAQSILFMLAGFDTSSTLLTYASYELALNCDIQDKLREDTEKIIAKHGGQCTHEALNEMTYLEMVLYETMRMHPAVPRIDRECTIDYTLAGTNVLLEKGSRVAIPIVGLHYDSDYYPDPDVFKPERFTAEEKNKRSPYVYLPFGTGPRNCIGWRFAMMSTKMAMAHLITNFKFVKTDKTTVPSKPKKSGFLLKPEGGLWLQVEKLE